MREQRSPSQILFSLLPEQTVDLGRRIWKVDKWLDPIPLSVDTTSVRRRLVAALDPWARAGQDNGASDELRKHYSLEVVRLNRERGVHVELWPQLWRCTRCGRLGSRRTGTCKCGGTNRGQFHFVGYHECGHLSQPWAPSCPIHNELAVKTPGSSKVKDLLFYCPVCQRELQRGLRVGARCMGCQQSGTSYNVHRAASVYTPHSITMVNPPRPEQLAEIKMRGGEAACLEWLLDGMPGDRPGGGQDTRQSFIDKLVATGMAPAVAELTATAAAASGHAFADTSEGNLTLSSDKRALAQDEATDVVLAVYDGRRSITGMQDQPVGPDLQSLYRDEYSPRLAAAGLTEIDLIDRFPVLKGVFGYSRGGGTAGSSRVVMFRGKAGAYRVYADSSETEAFFVRLDPQRVARWLQLRGHLASSPTDDKAAREAILSAIAIPDRGADSLTETPGSAVLTLLHSYTHRLIRQLAVMAGIDRESLAEYLVPHHLGAFVYAAPKGDFVLGGMQAVFETDMHLLLARQAEAENRCPLDPGCARAENACPACLHLGEPSCAYYNRFLRRDHLFGPAGYLSMDS
jgi:hypothetical protein